MNYAARSLRLRMPRVCVAVTGSEPAQMMERAETVLKENTFLELRLDYLKSPAAVFPKLTELIRHRPDAIFIATCRRANNGGHFKGSVAAQIEILKKAIECGCQAVDVEVETAEAMKPTEWEELRERAAVILSFHDFKATRNLEQTFEKMLRLPADVYKVVSTATCLHDNVQVLNMLSRYSSEHCMVAFCMGDQGLISRILSLRAGGLFTFGAVLSGEATAPGQPTYRELRDLYRVEQVDAVTKVYGVAGDPVSHSMSPSVLNAAFRRENVNAVYLPLHARKIDDLMSCVKEIPLSGMSVTMPYKQDIAKHLDNSDVLTQQTGACNTVVRSKDGKLFGFNTDVYGLTAALEARLSLRGAKVLVIGAGGVARAAVYGLKARGAEVFIVNRTPATANALAKQADVKTVKRSDLAKLAFDVIVNGTPVGMGASSKQSPLEQRELNARWVLDTVYNPIETKLIQMAKSAGLGTISGAEMFLHQAARQFEIWTGKPAPIDSMRQVLLRQLGATSADGSISIATVTAPLTKPKAVEPAPAPEAEQVKKAAPVVAKAPSADGNKAKAKKPEIKLSVKSKAVPKPKVAPKVAPKPKAAAKPVKKAAVKTKAAKR